MNQSVILSFYILNLLGYRVVLHKMSFQFSRDRFCSPVTRFFIQIFRYLIGPATAVVTARIMPPPASTDSIQKARQLKAESQLSNAAGVRKRALPSTAALADDGESSGSNFQLLVEEKYDTIT